MKKIILVLVALILCIPIFAYAKKGGNPSDNLQQQIDELRQQIEEIQLIPGPPGPQGEQGLPGPQGPPGEMSQEQIDALCFLYDNLSLQRPSFCPDLGKIIFVTSSEYTGNLGGLAGADFICSQHAEAAGLSGTYMAWLSDKVTGASTRLTHSAIPYRRTDLVLIANDWADLTDGNLLAPIDRDENGYPRPSYVWTNTDEDGIMFSPVVTTSCDGWTDASPNGSGIVGHSSEVDGGLWSVVGELTCESSGRLYCVEQ